MSGNREWKRGDVATVRLTSFASRPQTARAFVDLEGCWQFADGSLVHVTRSDLIDWVRPLVVIDPEVAEQVRSLWLTIAHHAPLSSPEALQAALHEFARPTSWMKEPTGLGAVVEGDEGMLFVKWSTLHRADRNWKAHDLQGGDYRAWPDVNAVRILSPGVDQ